MNWKIKSLKLRSKCDRCWHYQKETLVESKIQNYAKDVQILIILNLIKPVSVIQKENRVSIFSYKVIFVFFQGCLIKCKFVST